MPRLPEIRLSTSEQERLVTKLKVMIESAEVYHSTEWADKHKIYMRQYLAQPATAQVLKPYKGASNLFPPLTRVICEGILAREDDALFNQDPPFQLYPWDNSPGLAESERLNLYYANLWKYVLRMRQVGKDWLKDNAIDGTSVVAPRWSRIPIFQRIQSIEQRERVRDTPGGELLGIDLMSPQIDIVEELVERVTLKRHESPEIENVDLSTLYVAPGSGTSLQWPHCPWYFKKRYLSHQAVLDRKREKTYDNIDAELLSQLHVERVEDRDQAARKQAGVSENEAEPTVTLIEFYMRWPLPGSYTSLKGKEEDQGEGEEGWTEECIVSYWFETGKLARIVPLARVVPPGPDGLCKRPDVDMRYKRIPRQFYGLGIPAMMFQLQKAMNQFWNMGVDYGTLSNIPFYFYEPSAGILPDMMSIEPGKGIPVSNASGIKMNPLRSDPTFFAQMRQEIQAWAERDGTINDFNNGRGGSGPYSPDTWHGQQAMLNESQLAFSSLTGEHAECFEEVMDRLHLLHMKNAPEVLKFHQVEGDRVREIEIPGSAFRQHVKFRAQINPNRQADQQNAMSIHQLMLAIPYINQIPQAVRALSKQVYDKTGSVGSKEPFEAIWPREQYEIQKQMADDQLRLQAFQIAQQKQQMEMMMQQQAMAAQQGMAPPPPQIGSPAPEATEVAPGMMPPTEPVERPKPEEENVKL